MLRVALALYKFGGELYFPDYIFCGSSFYILFVGYGDASVRCGKAPALFFADTFRVAFVLTNTTNKNGNGGKYHAQEYSFIYHALSYGVFPHRDRSF